MLILPLILPFVLDAASHADQALLPRFRTPDCETYVLGSRGAKLRLRALDWVGRQKSFDLGLERVIVSRHAPPDPALEEPNYVFFDRDPDEPTVRVIERFEEARAVAERQRRLKTRVAAKAPAGLETINAEQPLTPLQQAVLGITRPGLSADEISGTVFTLGDGSWRIILIARGEVISQFELSGASAEYGFYNRVVPWQFDRIRALHREQIPLARAPAKVDDFLRDHGMLTYVRQSGERRFGFLLPQFAADANDSEVRVMVALLRPTPREAMHTGEILYPRPDQARSGMLNQQVIDLGLRLRWTRFSANE